MIRPWEFLCYGLLETVDCGQAASTGPRAIAHDIRALGNSNQRVARGLDAGSGPGSGQRPRPPAPPPSSSPSTNYNFSKGG